MQKLVLLAVDDCDVAHVLRSRLLALGFAIYLCATVEQCLRRLADEHWPPSVLVAAARLSDGHVIPMLQFWRDEMMQPLPPLILWFPSDLPDVDMDVSFLAQQDAHVLSVPLDIDIVAALALAASRHYYPRPGRIRDRIRQGLDCPVHVARRLKQRGR
jgi:DNA-binding NtrC family response regulator